MNRRLPIIARSLLMLCLIKRLVGFCWAKKGGSGEYSRKVTAFSSFFETGGCGKSLWCEKRKFAQTGSAISGCDYSKTFWVSWACKSGGDKIGKCGAQKRIDRKFRTIL